MECKLFKLSNGETVLADTEALVDKFKDSKNITLHDPVLIKTFPVIDDIHTKTGKPIILEQYTMQPWIKMSKSDTITIPTESIVAVVEIDKSAIDSYRNFIDNYDLLQNELEDVVNDDRESELKLILEEYGKDTKTTIH